MRSCCAGRSIDSNGGGWLTAGRLVLGSPHHPLTLPSFSHTHTTLPQALRLCSRKRPARFEQALEARLGFWPLMCPFWALLLPALQLGREEMQSVAAFCAAPLSVGRTDAAAAVSLPTSSSSRRHRSRAIPSAFFASNHTTQRNPQQPNRQPWTRRSQRRGWRTSARARCRCSGTA